MEIKTLNDIYRCVSCGFIAARGNSYCRDCGTNFSQDNIAQMESNIKAPIGALPWNTRDRYRCVHCDAFIALADKYCRECGDEICDKEKQLMKLNMAELAKQNTVPLIWLAIFVLVVIVMLIAIVR